VSKFYLLPYSEWPEDGILCRKCNKALGGFGDDISIIKKAFNYLEGNRDGC
jgi:hypothetical protein